MKLKLLFLSLLLAFYSCSPDPVTPEPEDVASKNKYYVIREGSHSSGVHFALHNNKKWLNFSAVFNQNCLYDLESDDNYDINKLYGLTWGLTNDNNSFRIGWNCEKQNGKIQLFAYMHEQGVVRNFYLFEVSPCEWFSFQINFDRSNWSIHIYSESHNYEGHTDFFFNEVSNSGYYNYPYFGGNRTATHDMNFTIN